MNLQQNSSFVNRMRFPLLCEKSGAILLVLVGLTAGKFSNLSTYRIVRFFMKVQCCYSVTNGFSRIFHEKYIVKHVMEARESWTPCFLCRSLLLSTTVLNDILLLISSTGHTYICSNNLIFLLGESSMNTEPPLQRKRKQDIPGIAYSVYGRCQ